MGCPVGSPPAGACVPEEGVPGDHRKRRAGHLQLEKYPSLEEQRLASGTKGLAECLHSIDFLFVLPDLQAAGPPTQCFQQILASVFVPVIPAMSQ